jgi:hypothetical protein
MSDLVGRRIETRRERHTEHGVQRECRGPGGPGAELHRALGKGKSLCHAPYLLEGTIAGFLEADDYAEPGVTGEGSHDRRPDPDLSREAFRHEVAKRW